LGVVVIATAVAQQPLPSRPLLAFGDDRDWIVLDPVVYLIGDTADSIEVPAGFVTDLASIPRQFWGPPLYLTPTGQYSRAAIIHDYLYWSQKCSREQADRLLVIAMKESKVVPFDEALIYKGVNVGGKGAWKQNAKDKQSGLPRILPQDYRQPPDPNMTWTEYAKQLMKAGVKSLPVVDDGAYCHYGNSMQVPNKPKP
jgi:hypothetical protein